MKKANGQAQPQLCGTSSFSVKIALTFDVALATGIMMKIACVTCLHHSESIFEGQANCNPWGYNACAWQSHHCTAVNILQVLCVYQ